jgi:DNA-3-methyladenine glycosylase II
MTRIPTRGPFSLRELALFGFGHRGESDFDGVMRLAFCVDGGYERQVGVAVEQDGDELVLTTTEGADGRAPADLDAVVRQVARVLSVDHDGDAFADLGRRDAVIGRLQAAAPGLRPPEFYSPYEASVWSIISARRPRAQGMRLRELLNAAAGSTFDVAGRPTSTVPTPSALARVTSVPGLPPDRVPRLHAVAEAAASGLLEVDRLVAMNPEEAMLDLQRIPGIGPFYSSLIVIRACGLADLLPAKEEGIRALVRVLYDLDADLDEAAFEAFAERWRPFRTWTAVLVRAAASRVLPPESLPRLRG